MNKEHVFLAGQRLVLSPFCPLGLPIMTVHVEVFAHSRS